MWKNQNFSPRITEISTWLPIHLYAFHSSKISSYLKDTMCLSKNGRMSFTHFSSPIKCLRNSKFHRYLPFCVSFHTMSHIFPKFLFSRFAISTFSPPSYQSFLTLYSLLFSVYISYPKPQIWIDNISTVSAFFSALSTIAPLLSDP